VKTHASCLVAKVLKHTVKFKKSKLISVKRTVVVCTIVAATPTPVTVSIVTRWPWMPWER
jgi:hypothetical protein